MLIIAHSHETDIIVSLVFHVHSFSKHYLNACPCLVPFWALEGTLQFPPVSPSYRKLSHMPSWFKSSLLFKKKLFLSGKGIQDNFLEAVGMTHSNFLLTARKFSLQPFWMVISQPSVILPLVMGLTPPQDRPNHCLVAQHQESQSCIICSVLCS